MTELVGSHTAYIQKLEMQTRDLSREQNPKQKDTLPSDTIANPKGNGNGPTSHCMAITTQSGKLLEVENEQVVEVEDSEQEVGAQVEVPNVVEVERLSKKMRTQEVNQEEVNEKVIEAPKTIAPIPRPPPPFPRRLTRKVDDSKLEKFYDILKKLSVNIPFVEEFQEMPGFAKYLKDLITKRKTIKNEVVNVTHRVTSIIATMVVQEKEDPGAFTIPCTIGLRDFARVLCYNGASINLMPLAIYKQVGLGIPKPTIDDVLVKVGKCLLPVDFAILDCVVDNEIKFRVNDEEVTFQLSKGMKLPHAYKSISVIDVVGELEDAVEVKMEEGCLGEVGRYFGEF
uniref:Uncharacterized protein n=1 Tax=Nicotiana tabacum TaxID=4097 RepID=A0A1S4BE81_TOBAC|nr:PREDICTED: uncharacterized protein LOC107807303 [Nicotiana tabacum]